MMRRSAKASIWAVATAGLALVAALEAPGSAQAPEAQANGPAVSCKALRGASIGELHIKTAVVQPAQTPVPDAKRPDMTGEPRGALVSGLPAFCRVSGTIRPEAKSDIKFEIWLPLSGWNGRLFGANNGGFGGNIRYDDLAAAVRNGGVGAASDTGHSSADAGWAKRRPERVRDYGWRALHVTTVAAKGLARKFYGRVPDRSYFVGCSNGGRMGLMAASRFPADYDGILAGAPVVAWTGTAMSMINLARAQRTPGAGLRTEQGSLIQGEVLRQCDALDGQRDGLVDNPRQCRFDYAPLACGVSDSSLCLSALQITALKAISDGPHDKRGRRIAWGYPLSGGEVTLDNVGWDRALFSPRQTMATPLLEDLATHPLTTEAAFDFDVHPRLFRADPGKDVDPGVDLRPFFARGGKLILWHGWSDAILSPNATLDYFQRAQQIAGAGARASMRLFMVPGMQHCSGGPGADAFGQIGAAEPGARPEENAAAALTAWVEGGRVPNSLAARHGQRAISDGKATAGMMERLHCAWPSAAVLTPGADRDRAASYTCRAPRPR